MIHFLGVVLIIHACFSLIQYRKFMVSHYGEHNVPVDMKIEFLMGFALFLTYFVKQLKTLKKV